MQHLLIAFWGLVLCKCTANENTMNCNFQYRSCMLDHQIHCNFGTCFSRLLGMMNLGWLALLLITANLLYIYIYFLMFLHFNFSLIAGCTWCHIRLFSHILGSTFFTFIHFFKKFIVMYTFRDLKALLFAHKHKLNLLLPCPFWVRFLSLGMYCRGTGGQFFPLSWLK